jgi:hypothetical protein
MEEVGGMDLLAVIWLVCMSGIICVIPCLYLHSAWKERQENTLTTVSFDNLPFKDPGLSNEEQGLYNKFEVYRRDGSDEPGGKHDGCDYFVLDLSHDPFAAETITYYARACKDTHPLLAKDLMDRVRAAYQKLDDEGKL